MRIRFVLILIAICFTACGQSEKQETASLKNIPPPVFSVNSEGKTILEGWEKIDSKEGNFYATKSTFELKSKFKKKVRTPIIDAVYAVLYEGKNAKNVFLALTDQLD